MALPAQEELYEMSDSDKTGVTFRMPHTEGLR
jgi:hypothetical protein